MVCFLLTLDWSAGPVKTYRCLWVLLVSIRLETAKASRNAKFAKYDSYFELSSNLTRVTTALGTLIQLYA